MLIFTDRVLAQIDEHIGCHEPERGGALLSLRNSNVVAAFEADPHAAVSGASYVPTHELTLRVQQRELSEGLAFCGIVHSHPGDFDQPSMQDDIAFRKGLDINPHLPRFVAPIVTRTRSPRPATPRLDGAIGDSARMTLYVAYRSREEPRANGGFLGFVGARRLSGRRHKYRRETFLNESAHILRDRPGLVRIVRTAYDVLPLEQEVHGVLRGLHDDLGLNAERGPCAVTEIRGQPFFHETISLDHLEVQLLLPASFPSTRPILLITDLAKADPRTREQIDWDWSINDAAEQGFLWRRLKPIFVGAEGTMGRVQ